MKNIKKLLTFLTCIVLSQALEAMSPKSSSLQKGSATDSMVNHHKKTATQHRPGGYDFNKPEDVDRYIEDGRRDFKAQQKLSGEELTNSYLVEMKFWDTYYSEQAEKAERIQRALRKSKSTDQTSKKQTKTPTSRVYYSSSLSDSLHSKQVATLTKLPEQSPKE